MNIIYIALIINMHYISLTNQVPVTLAPAFANITTWDSGTMIYAHNFLAGNEFYYLNIGETVTALLSDGSTQDFQVTGEGVWLETDSWEQKLTWFSDPEHITLVTCFPETGPTIGRLIIELE